MKITFDVKKVTVIERGFLTDIVILHTDLPTPVPGVTQDDLTVEFRAYSGKGSEYVRENFPGIPMEIVKA